MEKQFKPVPDVECLKYHGTPEKPDIKIFVSHRIDKDSEVIDNPLYIPVRCGAVYDDRESVTMLGDDTGDNISEKRKTLCELTVQYWAWKNVDADYYGLCHYRRYFSFAKQKLNEDIHGAINYDTLHDQIEKELNISEQDVVNRVKECDFWVGAYADFRKVGINSLYEQYGRTPDLHIEDMYIAIDVLKEKYPEYADSADEYMNGHIFYPCNMFVMKKELFNEYSQWLFSILTETEKRIDCSGYSEEGIRTVGHIAERLLGVFYTYVQKHRKEVKTDVLQRTIVWNTELFEKPKPYFKDNNIAIAMCCSDFFVPYVSATIQSLIENSSESNNYDIIFMHTDIGTKNQKMLKNMASGHKNIELRFVNISSQVKSLKLIANNHVSVETFYRLLSAKIFSNYKKVLYLDSDLIILKDVADVYRIDMGHNLIAATVDADHAGEYNGAIPGVKKYCDEVLALKEPYQYFQAGVILFNIEEMNRQFSENELIEFAQKREYMYVDQDVLNVKCEGKVKYLDPRWNVLVDCNNFRVNGIIKRAPVEIYTAYMKSREEPYIIHYAGNEKPWNSPMSDYAEIFWQYSRKTPYYEAVIWRMSDVVAGLHTNFPNIRKKFDIKKIVSVFFPKGTKRREKLKALYYKLKW